MRVDFDVAMEIASHEALVRQTYKDSAGVLTWCVGMTNATGHNVERYIGNPAPLQHCMNLYVWALTNYAEDVMAVFKDHPLTQSQFAAAVSFHWNTGAIKGASWVGHFKDGNMAKAERSFMNWSKPPEIIPRREKERQLFFQGKWSNNGTMIEYTRVRSNMTPDWSSAKRINVEKELKAAFDSSASRPKQPPSGTKAKPVPKEPIGPKRSRPMGGPKQIGIVAAIIAAIAGAAVAFWDRITSIFGG